MESCGISSSSSAGGNLGTLGLEQDARARRATAQMTRYHFTGLYLLKKPGAADPTPEYKILIPAFRGTSSLVQPALLNQMELPAGHDFLRPVVGREKYPGGIVLVGLEDPGKGRPSGDDAGFS